MQTLAKIDKKVHFIKEAAGTRPKLLVKSKRKIDKMKNINDLIRTANKNTENPMLREFVSDPKQIFNKILIFDTTIVD